MRQASDIGRGFERPHPQAAFRRPSRKCCQANLRTAPCLAAWTNGVQGVHSGSTATLKSVIRHRPSPSTAPILHLQARHRPAASARAHAVEPTGAMPTGRRSASGRPARLGATLQRWSRSSRRSGLSPSKASAPASASCGSPRFMAASVAAYTHARPQIVGNHHRRDTTR
jgi:hypothetical protein